MNRISREHMFMRIAHTVAERATCQRLNVGAIIVRNNRIISMGYNGTPPGDEHCRGESCPGWIGGCKQTIHAEDNALRYIPDSITSLNLEMYCTDSPCPECWNLIKRDGRITRVYFQTLYRIHDHFGAMPVPEIYRVLPSGTVIDWTLNRIVKQ